MSTHLQKNFTSESSSKLKFCWCFYLTTFRSDEFLASTKQGSSLDFPTTPVPLGRLPVIFKLIFSFRASLLLKFATKMTGRSGRFSFGRFAQLFSKMGKLVTDLQRSCLVKCFFSKPSPATRVSQFIDFQKHQLCSQFRRILISSLSLKMYRSPAF